MGVEREDLPQVDGVDDASLALLVHRYGYFAHEVLALAHGAPELRERIVPDLPDLLAEVVVAARFEQAQSLGDVFLRRTRLGLLAANVVSEGEVPRRVARLLGGELGWDEARVESELSRWQDEAAAEGIALSKVAAG
jgi:glycerol-3-phosphate dehydrogenase